jgi:hypothetical protein
MIELTPQQDRILWKALLRSARLIDPGMLALAKKVAERPPLTEEQIIAGGIAFIIGDGS